MRTKYMEQIILGDLATFKKKGALATEAVNDYVHSVEDKVRQLTAIDIQEHFEKLQELLRKSCLTLDKITLGLGTLVPSPNGNCSRQIENAPRRMITSDSAPWPVWSSSDGSVKTDNERVVNSSSPDIVEGNQEVMVEPSSSSASSTASLSRPPFKARVESIIKQQPQRSSLDDEFAMEIPEPSRTLNADASEFIPSDASVLGPKSSSSKSSNDNIEQSDNPGNLGPENGLKPGARLDLVVGTKPEPPKHLTSSSSTESFLTASATDSEQTKQEEEEEQSLRKEIKKMAGYEINSRSSSGVGARDKEEGLAPNCYPSEAESLPSSLCTKNVIYDTEKVLRGTAQALQRHKASNGLCEEFESRPLSHQTKNDLLATGQVSKPAEEVLKERAEGYSLNDDLLDDAQSEWASKQTQGEIPRDVRKTRVPPLWTYVHVSFSDVDVKTGRIYVQMLADELNIQQLPEEINASQSLSKPLRMQDIAVGLIIIAPYDGARYRAKIVSKTSENDIEVFFIDYGNKAKVRLQDLTVANHKKYTKTCKMAIPCVLDDALEVPNLLDDLPDRAYVCLANPFEAEGEIVYRIMDVMSSTRENFREFPDPEPFSAGDDLGTLRVVVTHATSPKSMWLVETKDLAIPEQIERILEEMPVEPCSAQLVTKSVYVGYKGRRAMVLDRRDDLLDLLLLDDGKYEANVPLSVCRRLPLMAHMTPRAAKIASLANCHVPADRPDLEASMMESVIGKKFDMNVIDDDSREVMLVDPQTRKYLNKELKSKYGL